MRPAIAYSTVILLLLLSLASCRGRDGSDKINWSVTLDHQSKTPYGTAIAYQTIRQYFPGARREPLTRWFRYTGVDEHMHGSDDSAALLVMLGLDYYVSDAEWQSVLKFANAGNEVFLLCSHLDNHAERSLGCRKISNGKEEYPLSPYNDGTRAERALRLKPDTARAYGYHGRTIGSYFLLGPVPSTDSLFDDKGSTGLEERRDDYMDKLIHSSIDTTVDVLGTTSGEPNFIRYRVGDGHITLHAAPLVLSNYFLLQPDNREYLDAIWHSFPANISVVYWNEFFKRSTERSNMNVLLKYPATRWALIIAAVSLLLYVLFGLKRMQRIVPVIPPVKNASVSFVETVGQLYFNKGAHGNLAEKMIQHFLEWVRTHYYLDTTQLNDVFVKQLAAKSGKPESETGRLVNQIHEVRLGTVEVTPEYLYELYRSIQSFYKTRQAK